MHSIFLKLNRFSLLVPMFKRKQHTMKQFFSYNYFWSDQSNVGPFVLCLLSLPIAFRLGQRVYWHFRLHSLNKKEILLDRMEWLWNRLLEEEIELSCSQSPHYKQYDP